MPIFDQNASVTPPPPAFSPDEIHAQLHRITGSRVFADAHKLQKFLAYVVEESVAGRADRIKGFTVAQDVFDRDQPQDAQTSTIVRVEAGRLRRRLIEYYAEEGCTDPLRIEIPKGAYVPSFEKSGHDMNASRIGAGSMLEITAPPHQSNATNRRFRVLAATAVIVSGSLLAWWAFDDSTATTRLESPAGVTTTALPAIAVLPFADETTGESGKLLAAGLTEDIVTDLSRVQGLDVIALSSTREFQGQDLSPQAIGERLGVSHVLRGSVRGQSPNHRVTAQLFEASSNRQIWAERFDRDTGEMLQLQDELALRVVSGMYAGLRADSVSDSTVRKLVTDEARVLYWQAMDLVNPPGDSSRLSAARQAFQRAVEIDASYANAYAGLAYTYAFEVLFKHSDSAAADLQQATRLAETALEIDPSVGLAYTTLAFVEFVAENYDGALSLSRKALDVQPGDPYINAYHAYLLAADGQAAKGIQYAERALRLDPLTVRSPYMNILSYVSFYAGDYQKSLDANHGNRSRGGPFTPNHYALAVAANVGLGNFDEARTQLETLDGMTENDSWAHGPLADKFRRQEDRELLADQINDLRSKTN
jgi:adenylate cyclase